MTYRILLLTFALLLVGCQTDPRIVSFEAGRKQVLVDKRVLADCEDWKTLSGPTDIDQLKAIKGWADAYKECKAWKAEANRIMKDTFNLE